MKKQFSISRMLSMLVILGGLVFYVTSCNQKVTQVMDIPAGIGSNAQDSLPDSFLVYIPSGMEKWYDDDQSNGEIRIDVRNSKANWDDFTPKNAPEGAPNILFVLYDDTGLGAWSPYGGGIKMPTLDALAKEGLIYTQWHTTALCSPTRSTIMTGRNHHLNGMASITETADGFPGANGRIPDDCMPFAEVLQNNGYSTFWIGKDHNVPETDVAPGGYRGEWPCQQGFDRFYGFLGGETNNWYPDLVEDNRFVEAPTRPNECTNYADGDCHPEDGYHLSRDLADKALEMLRNQQASNPHKPWYMWYCPGANHAPHHSPPSYTKKYINEGTFNDGYAAYRERTLDSMIARGILPPETALTEQNFLSNEVRNPLDTITSWETLQPEERDLYTRMAEVYAGFSEYTDSQIGRIIDYLKETGQYDNTIIIYAADNGASGEGSPTGSVNENKFFNGYPDELAENLKYLNTLGTAETYNHFPTGWASAFSTPFKMFKRYSQFAGGTNDPLVITWPKYMEEQGVQGEIRHQYHHSVDIVPTLLDAIGIEMPSVHNGVEQKSLSGKSMFYTFNSDCQPYGKTEKQVQYYGMLGTRGIWMNGWKAMELHAPTSGKGGYSDNGWELYRTEPLSTLGLEGDRSESNNLATTYPDTLQMLIDEWYKQAAINNVLPLDDRAAEQLLTINRPDPEPERNEYVYYPYTAPVPEGVAVNIRGRSYTIEATVENLTSNAGGVLFAHGSRFGGHTLYIKNQQLYYHYNFLGVAEESKTVSSGSMIPLTLGEHKLKAVFDLDESYDNDESQYGEHQGTLTLYIDDISVSTEIIKTQPAKFTLSGDGLCVGYDSADAITQDYPNLEEQGRFAGGTIKNVKVTVSGEAKRNLKADARRMMFRQ